MRHMLRFGGLLRREENHPRIFQSSLKTAGCATMDGVRGIIRRGCIEWMLKTDGSM
jgi:hypothetical protein